MKRSDHISLHTVQASSDQAAWSTRRRSKSNFALPYMWRLLKYPFFLSFILVREALMLFPHICHRQT